MKKFAFAAIAALALSTAPAFAADLPVKAKPAAAPPTPTWDIAFGGVVMSDYNFRGVSQSNRGPSGGAYFEPQYNSPIGQFYAGIGAVAIDWPTAYGFTSPSAEIDLYGGWRYTFFEKLQVDLGAIYYYYPKETFNGFTAQSDFVEIYGKFLYNVTSDLTLGWNIFYTPDLLHYSTTFAAIGLNNHPDGVYTSGTFKWVTPWKWADVGSFFSGELGHWFIEKGAFVSAAAIAAGMPGVDPSYTYWNAGLAFTYKTLTLDLRYHGTDQSVQDCANFLLVSVPNKSNNWCDDRFVVSLKFDTTVAVGH